MGSRRFLLTLRGRVLAVDGLNRQALAMIASSEVPMNDLITVRLPLDRVHDAIETVARGAAMKVTIDP